MHSEPAIAAQERDLGVKTDSPVTVSGWWLSNRFKKKKKKAASTKMIIKALHVSAVLPQSAVLASPPSCVHKGTVTIANSQSHGQENRGQGLVSQQQLTK